MKHGWLIVLALFAACATPAHYYKAPLPDTWEYRLDGPYGNLWDSGTLVLTGDDQQGLVAQRDYSRQLHNGEWRLTGDTVTITTTVVITAQWPSANRLVGTWQAPSGEQGRFVGARRGTALPD